MAKSFPEDRQPSVAQPGGIDGVPPVRAAGDLPVANAGVDGNLEASANSGASPRGDAAGAGGSSE